MIKSVTVTNHLGESLVMELRFPEKSGFLIRGEIDGLGPPKASITSTDLATRDGSRFTFAKMNNRNIVIPLTFLGSRISPITGLLEQISIEQIRHDSYKYFPLMREVRVQIETDERLCEAHGHVEGNDPTIFSSEEGCIISIVCNDPYFYSVEKKDSVFSGIEPKFHFPFSNESLVSKLLFFSEITHNAEKTVFYEGDISVGIVMHIHATGPATKILISNTRTREVMFIDNTRIAALIGSGFVAGDDITISTLKGNKYISLLRAGVAIDIRNSLGKFPSWFQVERGDNLFAYTAETGDVNLQFRVSSQIAYEGV